MQEKLSDWNSVLLYYPFPQEDKIFLAFVRPKQCVDVIFMGTLIACTSNSTLKL
jgi:hypothetical protein